ncbi:hypothetical protein [Paenibacillus taichungensis]|uniref:hypothetical protein n=1 Tax=Paenibacillus taichungensis TaxID=484184 RepID=UPI002877BE96|nr:hypothetical protein [Paenibacillus taichungensis]MEC0197076.1 hypothetical protein [Paenibacillus taichungensis]
MKDNMDWENNQFHQADMEGASAKLTELEAHKEELIRYIRKMEEADREDRSRVL